MADHEDAYDHGNAEEDPFGQPAEENAGEDDPQQGAYGEETDDPFGQQAEDEGDAYGQRVDNDPDAEENDDPFGHQVNDQDEQGRFNAFGNQVDDEDAESGQEEEARGYRGFQTEEDDANAQGYTRNEVGAFSFLQSGFCDDGEKGDEAGGFGDVVDEVEGDEVEEDEVEEDENLQFGDGELVVTGDEPQEDETEKEEIKTYPEWELATTRMRLFSIFEPSITEEMEQPPTWFYITLVYHLTYFFMVLLNIFLLVMETIPDVLDIDTIDSVQLIPTAFFTVDFVMRICLVTEWIFLWQIGLDLITLGAMYLILLKIDLGTELYFFPPLRSLRFFLITRVFVRTESVRDINLALRTIEESVKSILIFICLMVIGLLLFATFVFLFERGRFDSGQQRWYRPCKDFQEGCLNEEISPFQSIPDALWLVFQVMTTEGFGDAIPTTTAGRIVTGVAIIAGVFVIAYPAMVLIGNLDQMRQDYFAQQEKLELERAYQIDRKKILEQLENEQNADARTPTAAVDTSNLFGLDGMDPEEAEGLAAKALPADSRIVVFEPEHPPIHKNGFDDKTHTFAFMGNPAREIWETRNNEFLYDPILQILIDPADGLPVVSTPVYVGDETWSSFLTLVIDDIAAQDEATDAILEDGAHDDSFAHAQTIYALEVTLKSRIPGVKLKRRCDIGQINDYAIPLMLELKPDETEIDVFIQDVRQELMSTSLRLLFSTSPIVSGLWQKTVPITSIMLATTPFIQDLKDIAMNLSPSQMWSKSRRNGANKDAKTRRNVAYVTFRHLVALVYPVYRKVASPAYCIRNVSAFTDSIAAMIILHCRELRRHDIPDAYEQCVYATEEVERSERVYEVDVDYFRTNDWPLGTTTIEFSEKRPKGELTVDIGQSGKYEQPLIVDIASYKRDGLPSNVTKLSFEETLNATRTSFDVRKSLDDPV